jgi:hypothetical protein
MQRAHKLPHSTTEQKIGKRSCCDGIDSIIWIPFKPRHRNRERWKKRHRERIQVHDHAGRAMAKCLLKKIFNVLKGKTHKNDAHLCEGLSLKSATSNHAAPKDMPLMRIKNRGMNP